MGNIYAVRVVGGREKNAAKAILREVNKRQIPIQAILVTEDTKGYIYIEAETASTIRMILNLPFVMKRLPGRIPIDSIHKFLRPTPMSEKLKVNDLVEIVTGPFRGQLARVKSINKHKNTVRVILVESSYQAPVKMTAEMVSIARRR